MIPAYNCIAYLVETLESVLCQDLGVDRMQIEVVDDCSTDGDVESLVQAIGKGRVAYYRQPRNVGSLRNFETCINRAKGHLIHLLHGDDRIKPGFYQKMGGLFESFPEAGAAFCGYEVINEEGIRIGLERKFSEDDCILENWLYTIAEKQRIQYASIVVKREVYENLGSFYGVTYGEDWEMWARIATKYPTAYSPLFLSEYRLHTNSISAASFANGKNLRDVVTVVKTINTYLPEIDRKRLYRQALNIYTQWNCEMIGYEWNKNKNPKFMYRQLFEILRVWRDWKLVKRCGRIFLTVSAWQMRRFWRTIFRLNFIF